MRISDWSSDVCSSDLAKRGLSTSHLASVRFREGSAGGGLAVSFAFWRGNPAITRGSNVYVQSIDWDSVTNPRNPAGTMWAGLQQAPIVEPVDPFEGRVFHGLEGSPGSAAMDDLGLVKAINRLSQNRKSVGEGKRVSV